MNDQRGYRRLWGRMNGRGTTLEGEDGFTHLSIFDRKLCSVRLGSLEKERSPSRH